MLHSLHDLVLLINLIIKWLMSIFQRLGKYLDTKKTKTLFAVRNNNDTQEQFSRADHLSFDGL